MKYKNKTAPTGKAWCSKCEDYLSLNSFYKTSATTLGVVHQCIECIKNRYKLEVKEKREEYFSTPKGKASRMWNDILARAENRDGKHPAYKNIKVLITKDEFMSWVLPELEKWMLNKDISLASIDRINSQSHYELSNLQILDRWENARKTNRVRNADAPFGKAWCGICKDYKPNQTFSKGSGTINGLQLRCKECVSRINKEKRKKTKITLDK